VGLEDIWDCFYLNNPTTTRWSLLIFWWDAVMVFMSSALVQTEKDVVVVLLKWREVVWITAAMM